MHELIVSRLIESGYQVFISVGMNADTLLVISPEGNIQKCRARTASIDKGNSSVLKISEREMSVDIVAAFDPVSRNVWVIPSIELSGMTAIRLGKKWDDYLAPEPVSIEFKERKASRDAYLEGLMDRARGVADKKGEQNDS